MIATHAPESTAPANGATNGTPHGGRHGGGPGAANGAAHGAGSGAAPVMPGGDPTFERLAERADAAARAVEALEEAPRAAARELLASVDALHKQALTTIVKRLKDDEAGRMLLFALVDEPEVRAVLSMHGLIRADVRTRVQRVLEMVKPYLQSHGGDVEFVDLEGDRVRVRLSGACNGCSMSAVTLRDTVEASLREHVPGISGVEVVPNEPTPALVTLESRKRTETDGWIAGPRVHDVDPTRPFKLDGPAGSAIITRRGNVLQAFRNACAHQGLPLDGATIDAEDGTLVCPWHGFRFDCTSGECFTTPQAQLEPLPLRIDGDVVWVRIT